MDEQECNTCLETKPLTGEFWQIDNSKKNGWNKRCKACWKERHKARRLNIIKAINNKEGFGDFATEAANQQRIRTSERAISVFQEISVMKRRRKRKW